MEKLRNILFYITTVALLSSSLFVATVAGDRAEYGWFKYYADTSFVLSYLGFCHRPRLGQESFAFFKEHQKHYQITAEERELYYPTWPAPMK